MAITVTNIGTNTGSVTATVVITVPVGGVPVGSVIIVCVADSSISAVGGSVADTGGNTYTRQVGQDNNALTTNGFGAVFTAPVTTALVSGNSITYTLALTAAAAVSAFWVQVKSSPLIAVSAAGSSTTPSNTGSGVSRTGTFCIGVVSTTNGSGDAFTQDSTNAAWATPPVRIGLAGGPTIAGGSVTNNTTNALTYAPTFGTSNPWADMILIFDVVQVPYTPISQLGPTLAQ